MMFNSFLLIIKELLVVVQGFIISLVSLSLKTTPSNFEFCKKIDTLLLLIVTSLKNNTEFCTVKVDSLSKYIGLKKME